MRHNRRTISSKRTKTVMSGKVKQSVHPIHSFFNRRMYIFQVQAGYSYFSANIDVCILRLQRIVFQLSKTGVTSN